MSDSTVLNSADAYHDIVGALEIAVSKGKRKDTHRFEGLELPTEERGMTLLDISLVFPSFHRLLLLSRVTEKKKTASIFRVQLFSLFTADKLLPIQLIAAAYIGCGSKI